MVEKRDITPREALKPTPADRALASDIVDYVAAEIKSRRYEWSRDRIVDGVMTIITLGRLPQSAPLQPRAEERVRVEIEGLEDGTVACMREVIRPARGGKER